MNSQLHAHQELAIEQLAESIRVKKRSRPMLQAPTAFGKTVLAAAVVERALKKNNRIAFCVPKIELVDQTVRAFYEEGITAVGVMQANHHMTNSVQPVQVCSGQTLATRGFPNVKVAIIDEAHEHKKVYERWMQEHPEILFIGMTATPWSKGLGKFYDDLIIATTTKELIAKGFLSPFRVYAPSSPDLTGVRTTMGDYNEGDLGKKADQKALTADVVETWLELGEQRPTLCYGIDRAHAQALQERFQAAGVEAAYMDCYTPRNERDIIRMKFHAGIVKVVCNVGVLTTGVDWDVRCISLARPTKSEILFVQIIGRGLRTADGKKDCLILDHSDSHLRLGFVDDIHHDKLDDGKHREQRYVRDVPLAQVCQYCKTVLPLKATKCPECGTERTKRERKAAQEAEGKLAELRSGFDRKTAKRQTKNWNTEDKATFYAELLGYAIDHERKKGWAAHTYRARFGVWPNAHTYVEPLPPTAQTESYIRSRNIAWAKSKRRQPEQQAETERMVQDYYERQANG